MLNNREGKINNIRNLLWLPAIYLFLLKCVQKQKRFLKSELEPELEPFRRENDGSLTEAHFKKIINYYAMGVPSILGESLCVLRGFSFTREERLCMSYLGGISGILDDLFDEPGKSAAHLEDFIFSPEKLIPATSHEKLLKHFYIKGLSYSSQPEKIKKAAFEVFKSQQKSLIQKASASEEQITDLSFLKGGNSFLYYRLCLSHGLDKKEEKMLYQLGGLMQLGNDIFDVWEDFRDGISTIATSTTDLKKLRRYFNCELEKTHELLATVGFAVKKEKKFKRMINLAIARVYVCLDQFEALAYTTAGDFIVTKYSRKQLICDMQKPVNQLKAISYYLGSRINFD